MAEQNIQIFRSFQRSKDPLVVWYGLIIIIITFIKNCSNIIFTLISDNSTSFTFSSFINFSWNIINIGDFNIIILLISNLVKNLIENFELDKKKNCCLLYALSGEKWHATPYVISSRVKKIKSGTLDPGWKSFFLSANRKSSWRPFSPRQWLTRCKDTCTMARERKWDTAERNWRI